MATLDQIVERVLANLDRQGYSNPADKTAEENRVAVWVNQCIREDLSEDISWVSMEFTADAFTAADNDIIDVPAALGAGNPHGIKDINMVRFCADSSTYNYTVLPEVDERVLFERYSDINRGQPTIWARTGENIRLRPTPAVTGTGTKDRIQIVGWKYLPDLAAGESNEITDRHSRLVEWAVTSRALLYYGDYEKAAYHMQMFQQKYQMAINNEKRRKAPANLVMRPSPTAGKPVSPGYGTGRIAAPYGWNN